MSFLMKSLAKLKVSQLKEICRDFNISGYSDLNKGDLVTRILRTLSEKNITDILIQKGIIKEEIPSQEDIMKKVDSDRKIDNRTYLNYLLQSLTKKQLSQICRDFLITNYSGKSKPDLIEFILDSLAEEEYARLIYNKELDIISDGIESAIQKIQGKDREHIKKMEIVNPDLHELELEFKGWKWEVTSFLSITENNMNNPDRDCDCRIGSAGGFCSHFWIGFIVSLKEGFLKLEDWTLTKLPEDFEARIKSLKLQTRAVSKKDDDEDKSELIIIDQESEQGKLMKYLDKRITIYQSEIIGIERVESEIKVSDEEVITTIYYIIDLKDIEFGPQIKRKKDFDEKKLQKLETLKVRLSDKKYGDVSIQKGDAFGCNGTVTYDDFHKYYILMRSTKPTTHPQKPK
ncbi:MAG: hypothetical protein BAJALOKI1v1_420015 [Promethearchaeota archaeon]|nr:MAG: hypothetical protein BAJALOKI1v1_420015 [Candidatus Lokiarchaeota archaeon]